MEFVRFAGHKGRSKMKSICRSGNNVCEQKVSDGSGVVPLNRLMTPAQGCNPWAIRVPLGGEGARWVFQQFPLPDFPPP